MLLLSIRKYINLFINLFINFFKLYFPEKKHLYKIEEINEYLNQVVISCRRKNAILVSTIEDIGHDQYIINYLPPHQACWIGYYFGKNWFLNKMAQQKTNSSESQYPNHQDSNYKIIYQNRRGELIYQNSYDGFVYTMDPIELAKSKTITLFNASQAFYIGFLAGLKSTKDVNKKLNINKPILKLVK